MGDEGKEVCLAHSGLVQKMDTFTKILEKHDKELEMLKKNDYKRTGAIMIITPFITVLLQRLLAHV